MIEYINELGLDKTAYYIFHVLGFLAVFVFNYFYARNFNIQGKKAIIITILVYSLVYLWIYVQYWIESGFRSFGGNNIVRGFIYVPLIAYPILKLFKIKWKVGCDFIAPCVPLVHAVSHVGCIFEGCCKGYPCSFGISSPDGTQTLFPSQLFEAATAGIIVLIVVWFSKKRAFDTKGYAYPLMLILFGSTRFLWEFARDNQKILLGCSSLSFHALFMCIVGVIMILYFRHNYSKVTLIQDNKNSKKTRKNK